jgi:hypothetical protein
MAAINYRVQSERLGRPGAEMCACEGWPYLTAGVLLPIFPTDRRRRLEAPARLQHEKDT